MAIARWFDEGKDDGSFVAGVPKRDVTEEEWEALPAYLQRSADASPLYRKTKPRQEKEGDT